SACGRLIPQAGLGARYQEIVDVSDGIRVHVVAITVLAVPVVRLRRDRGADQMGFRLGYSELVNDFVNHVWCPPPCCPSRDPIQYRPYAKMPAASNRDHIEGRIKNRQVVLGAAVFAPAAKRVETCP